VSVDRAKSGKDAELNGNAVLSQGILLVGWLLISEGQYYADCVLGKDEHVE